MSITNEITYAEAIRQAIAEEMRRDRKIFIIGEDISADYYMMGTTWKLVDEFGPERVRDTPISESAFTGAALGAALLGFRPIVEVMFNDILTYCIDQIVNQIAKVRYVTGGQVQSVPIVLRTRNGSAKYVGPAHSQTWEAWFAHTPGLLVALPSTPYDAKGMLKTALRGKDPVMFFEHKLLYGLRGKVPTEDYVVPFGKADIKRAGGDVTLVAYQLTLHEGLKAAEELGKQGIDVEIVDPRTLYPLDMNTILRSVEKTGRLVVAHEACKLYGAGAEIVSSVVEKRLSSLKASPRRIGLPHVPYPVSPPLEDHIMPTKDVIMKTIREVVKS